MRARQQAAERHRERAAPPERGDRSRVLRFPPDAARIPAILTVSLRYSARAVCDRPHRQESPPSLTILDFLR